MRIDILTLFPEMCSAVYSQSIVGRAINKNILQIFSHNIRDYTVDKHKNVDDIYSVGYVGGNEWITGMIRYPELMINIIR